MHFAENKNIYKPDKKEQVSILDHVRKMVVKLMTVSDNYDEKKSKKSAMLVSSSESETESTRIRSDERESIYNAVLDDYLGIRPGSLNKSIKKALEGKKDVTMYELATLYLDLEHDYAKRANCVDISRKKWEYEAKAAFCRVGHMSMRNCNSSSILERAFSDSMRSVAGRRASLREVFISIKFKNNLKLM